VVHEIATVSGRIEGNSIELMPVFTRKVSKLQPTGFVPEKLVRLGRGQIFSETARG